MIGRSHENLFRLRPLALHLEFEKGTASKLELPTGDVLLLVGDIYLPWSKDKREKALFQEFFKRASENFREVLVIAGNHEHWGGYFVETLDRQRAQLEHFGNVRVLQNSAYQVDNVVFWGSTFWTDCRNAHPEVMWDVKRGMNDYGEVTYSRPSEPYYQKVKLMAEDTVNENQYARKQVLEFMTVAEQRGTFPVVMTHHAPSWNSVAPVYRLDNLSYAYANTGLEEFMMDFPDSIWLHGHMHEEFDYMVGKCRVMANPRGYYGYESRPIHFAFKKLEFPNA